jgi:hypothetical protein
MENRYKLAVNDSNAKYNLTQPEFVFNFIDKLSQIFINSLTLDDAQLPRELLENIRDILIKEYFEIFEEIQSSTRRVLSCFYSQITPKEWNE